jgi:hypothetical protein
MERFVIRQVFSAITRLQQVTVWYEQAFGEAIRGEKER